MAQINRAAVVSQWAECMIIGKERVAIRTAYTHLSEDEQLAYLSEGGNVAPVVLGLRKAYNDKVDRNQMLLDEIKTLTDSFDQAKARTLAHEQANDAIPDREEAERVQRLYHDTLTQLKTRCADELGLESPTVQVPFKFIPAASSNVAALFAESTEQGLVTPIPDETGRPFGGSKAQGEPGPWKRNWKPKRIAEEKFILLESTSNGTTQELTEAKQQLNRSEEEVTELKEEKAAAEKEKAESDEAVGVLQAEKDQLVKDKEEMQQKWEQELQDKLEEVQKESEDHMDEADALRVKLKNSTNEWSSTLMEVLAAGFTGNDITPHLIRPMLAPELSNMTDLEAEESSEYLFAERYINPNAAPEPTPEDVTTLETHLLESIRKRQKQGSPVLLAFQILLNKVKSKDWLARCISCVRLAVLGGQYVMKDVEAWAKLVGDLRSAYPQLDVDPLAQACIAKLALTTINKTSHMCQALAEAYDQGGFTKNTLIPSIVTLLHDDGVVQLCILTSILLGGRSRGRRQFLALSGRFAVFEFNRAF
ncbi:hypothetical protein D6D10_10489 [Aureobasidium pullulans]|uniref:Uncharacterized protein n=1 Tax=Aureobasidium pullulans TaxID=5580 RepID=A0A4S9DP20_AURPU|nr:hypothetical protein D6D10_10489 [Aureobasidium pullulans]